MSWSLLDLFSSLGTAAFNIPKMVSIDHILNGSINLNRNSSETNYKLSLVWEDITYQDKQKILFHDDLECFLSYVKEQDIKDELVYGSCAKQNSLKLVKSAFICSLFIQLSLNQHNNILDYYKQGLLSFVWDNEKRNTIKAEFIYNFIKHNVPLSLLQTLPVQDFKNPELLYNLMSDPDIQEDTFMWILSLNDMDICWNDIVFETKSGTSYNRKKKEQDYFINIFPVHIAQNYHHSLLNYFNNPLSFEKAIADSKYKDQITSSEFYKNYQKNVPSSFLALTKAILHSRRSTEPKKLNKYFSDCINLNQQKIEYMIRAILEFNKFFVLRAGNLHGQNVFKNLPESIRLSYFMNYIKKENTRYNGKNTIILIEELNIPAEHEDNIKTIQKLICHNDLLSLNYLYHNQKIDFPFIFQCAIDTRENRFKSKLPNVSCILTYAYEHMSYEEKKAVLTHNNYEFENIVTPEKINLHYLNFIMKKRNNLEFMSFVNKLTSYEISMLTPEILLKIKNATIGGVTSSNNHKNMQPLLEIQKLGISYTSVDVKSALSNDRNNKHLASFLFELVETNDMPAYVKIIEDFALKSNHYSYHGYFFDGISFFIENHFSEEQIENLYSISTNMLKSMKTHEFLGNECFYFYSDIFNLYAKRYNLNFPLFDKAKNYTNKKELLLETIEHIEIIQDKALLHSKTTAAPSSKQLRI